MTVVGTEDSHLPEGVEKKDVERKPEKFETPCFCCVSVMETL